MEGALGEHGGEVSERSEDASEEEGADVDGRKGKSRIIVGSGGSGKNVGF